MSHSIREGARLAKLCCKQGFRVKETRSGWVVFAKDGLTTVGWHGTPSDKRAARNLTAALRRIGVDL